MKRTVVALMLICIAIASCDPGAYKPFTEEESTEVGEYYVTQSELYRELEGRDLEETGIERLDCEDCFLITYSYLGVKEDLPGMVVPVEARVTVRGAQVTDMESEELEPIPAPPEENVTGEEDEGQEGGNETDEENATSPEESEGSEEGEDEVPPSSMPPLDEENATPGEGQVPADQLESFCGTSTQAECVTDEDCASAGCSGQVCASSAEAAEIVTTCEFRECYESARYGLSCGCNEGRCAWA